MTLSFHKVYFSAEEVLELAEDVSSLEDFVNLFIEKAENRSRN